MRDLATEPEEAICADCCCLMRGAENLCAESSRVFPSLLRGKAVLRGDRSTGCAALHPWLHSGAPLGRGLLVGVVR